MVREALVEQKVHEALAQLPPGTPRNDSVLRRVEPHTDDEHLFKPTASA
jgi:hypothetical protein